jgi:hypothetical protein
MIPSLVGFHATVWSRNHSFKAFMVRNGGARRDKVAAKKMCPECYYSDPDCAPGRINGRKATGTTAPSV